MCQRGSQTAHALNREVGSWAESGYCRRAMTSTFAWPQMTPATRLVGTHLMSNLADGVRLTAFPLLVFALTASPMWVSATFAAGLVPSVLIGPVAGAVADRCDRRRLVRAVTAARTLMLLVLAATIAAGTTPIMLVVVVAALFGVGEAFADTTMATLVPNVVPRERLDTVYGHLVGVQIVGNELIGPAIGSALFGLVAWLPFVSASGMLTIAIVLLGGLTLLAAPALVAATAPTHQSDSMLAGLSFVTGSEVLRRVISATALLAAIDAAWFALLVVLVTGELGLSAATFGLLLAVGSVGGLAGAALAPRITVAGGAALAAGVFGGMGLSLAAVWLAPSVVTVTIALVVTSAGFAAWNVAFAGVRQRATPDRVRGRVVAVSRTVTLLASLTAALGGGWFTARFGIDATIGVAAAALFVSCPLVSRSMRGIPLRAT